MKPSNLLQSDWNLYHLCHQWQGFAFWLAAFAGLGWGFRRFRRPGPSLDPDILYAE